MNRTFALVLCVALAGCAGTSSPPNTPPVTTNLTKAPWTITLAGGDGSVITASLQSAQTCSAVTGPACFMAAQLNANDPGNPGAAQALEVGVPVNPVPNGKGGGYGMAFDFQYQVSTDNHGLWYLDGQGSFQKDGTIAGTWTCDSQTPACGPVAYPTAGLSGTFTAVQQ